MKRITKSAFGLALVILATSCAKQPDASFTTDKTEYVAGETIKLKNTSIDGVTYKWTMPDGQTSSAVDLDYTTDLYQDDATLSFKLIAFSKKDKKSSETTESVKVKAATGDLTMWIRDDGTDVSDIQSIQVTLSSGNVKNITGILTSTPDCGNAYSANFTNVKVGKYKPSVLVVYTDGSNVTLTVSEINVGKGCNIIEIQ